MERPGGPAEKKAWYKYPAWLAAAGFLLYGYSLSFGFNYLDDTVILVYQDFLKTAANLAEVFRRDVMLSADGSALYYRPLPGLLTMLEAMAGGTSPALYRCVNLLLHLLASFLVFRTFVKLRYPEKQAFYLSLIFLAHPVVAQTVCWIPGSNASLLAVFSLAAFLYAAEFWESGRLRCAAAHAFFFTCAMFTKESAVALAPLCLLYRGLAEKKKLFPGSLPLAAGWALGFAAWFLLRSLAFPESAGLLPGGMFRAFTENLPVLASGLGNILLPLDIPVMTAPCDVNVLAGLTAVFLGGWLLYRSAPRPGYIVFGVAWFLLFFIPGMLSPMQAASNFMPHRLYLPLFGILLLFLEGCRLRTEDGPVAVRVKGLVLVLLCGLTFWQTLHYRGRMSFWRRAAADSPGSVLANAGFGLALGEAGEPAAAETAFRKALSLDPSEVNANYNFAALLETLGRLEEAEPYYRRALLVSPGFSEARYRLGSILASRGKLEEAIGQYREALSLKPDYPEVHHNLGVALASRGDAAQAGEHYREALRLKPDFAEAHYNLATLLASQGNAGEAAEHFREALRLRPDFPEAHVNLGYLAAVQGRLAEAETHYREALRLRPDLAVAHNSWGIALNSAGDTAGAILHFREALRLAPGCTEARKNLEILSKLKKRK
ncbi:MAG: hypothetical protein COT18_10610 [Elusimicrobia bacterium CG08_land_8_20_14_0_20_59_10]|nr:MAG: hypothetical protein COT18_10610 [Elusimicrobia bacterium CG08_land_8_20_14_0_20_59_10]